MTSVDNSRYDFVGESYSTHLHRYPATMLPQIGVEIIKELGLGGGRVLLDPYCGSGSSITAALSCGFTRADGYDLNPLAALICLAKFRRVSPEVLAQTYQALRNQTFDFIKDESNIAQLPRPKVNNLEYWFSPGVTTNLAVLKKFVFEIPDDIAPIFKVVFSETVRECSYTRNGEFKLFRIKPEMVLSFNPDAVGVYFSKLSKALDLYRHYYEPLTRRKEVVLHRGAYSGSNGEYDLVLTSPPYGDSKITVAYGQFSTLSNEWMDVADARKIDSMLMGGKPGKRLYLTGVIGECVAEIAKTKPKRATEVSGFYFDLADSIAAVARGTKPGGYAVYVVGNRTVNGACLPTDGFIAERFVENGIAHLFTYRRKIGNKSMPSRNSPSNRPGETCETMNYEYIVVCRKK